MLGMLGPKYYKAMYLPLGRYVQGIRFDHTIWVYSHIPLLYIPMLRHWARPYTSITLVSMLRTLGQFIWGSKSNTTRMGIGTRMPHWIWGKGRAVVRRWEWFMEPRPTSGLHWGVYCPFPLEIPCLILTKVISRAYNSNPRKKNCFAAINNSLI